MANMDNSPLPQAHRVRPWASLFPAGSQGIRIPHPSHGRGRKPRVIPPHARAQGCGVAAHSEVEINQRMALGNTAFLAWGLGGILGWLLTGKGLCRTEVSLFRGQIQGGRADDNG